MEEVSSSYLSDLLENHPLVSNDLRLYKKLNVHLVENLKRSRETFQACQPLSNDGSLLLFDSTNDCLKSFNPVNDELTQYHTAAFNHLANFTAVTLGSYIYVVCGNRSVHRLNFSIENSNWERMQDLLAGHGPFPPVVTLSGAIFAVCSWGRSTKDVEILNPAVTNDWVKLKDKPKAAGSHTLVSLDESVYCIGGWDRQRSISSFCRFTPLSSMWADLTPMKTARHLCGAVAVERRIFVMRGVKSSTETRDIECYDVTSGQWSSLAPTIECHTYCFAHHFNGWIFLVKPRNDSWCVEKYDIENDRWSNGELVGHQNFTVYQSVSIKI